MDEAKDVRFALMVNNGSKYRYMKILLSGDGVNRAGGVSDDFMDAVRHIKEHYPAARLVGIYDRLTESRTYKERFRDVPGIPIGDVGPDHEQELQLENAPMKENKTSLFPRGKKVDISMELYRRYKFPGGEYVKIDEPQFLIVTDNGHRIGQKDNKAHYVPYGWIDLEWETGDESHFFCERDDDEKAKLVLE